MDLRDTPEEAGVPLRGTGVAGGERARRPARAHLARGAARSRGRRRRRRRGARSSPDAGYAGLTWPVEFGGRGAPLSYQAIYLEEAAAVQAPVHLAVIGLGMIGPTIIAHGTTRAEGALPGEDPHRGGGLVPGLLRARCRLRPRRRPHPRRPARRRLRRQRPEGVVVVRADRRLVHVDRPDRLRSPSATRG